MSRHILVVHQDPDLAKMAVKAVKRAFGTPEPYVIKTSNFEDALQNLAEGNGHEWALIVTGAAVPESARSGATPGQYDALYKFLMTVRAVHQMPIMVIFENSRSQSHSRPGRTSCPSTVIRASSRPRPAPFT